MNYVKQTWDEKTWGKGQKFLQDSLNHMEAGIAQGGGQAVTKWFTALRVMAGWTDDDARCIYINYIDDTGAVQKVELVKEGDEGLYQVADFRSDLLMVKAPYRSSKVLIA